MCWWRGPGRSAREGRHDCHLWDTLVQGQTLPETCGDGQCGVHGAEPGPGVLSSEQIILQGKSPRGGLYIKGVSPFSPVRPHSLPHPHPLLCSRHTAGTQHLLPMSPQGRALPPSSSPDLLPRPRDPAQLRLYLHQMPLLTAQGLSSVSASTGEGQ